MQEGETGTTWEKRHNRGTGIEAVLVRAPRLQRPAGHIQPLGRLTLGEALGLPITILPQQRSAFEALPALMAILVALLLLLPDRAPSDLLFPSFASGCVMAQDGEVAFWFQPFVRASLSCLGLSSRPSGRRGDRGPIFPSKRQLCDRADWSSSRG